MEGKVYDFAKIRVSVEGAGELNPAMSEEWKFGEPLEEPTLDNWFQWANEEAESIGMRIEAHPEHGKVLCSLMLADRDISFSDPRTLVQYITGIKLALEMMMRGEITCERQEAKE